jgi:polar amino acid transport system substrate-binding protein
MRAKSIFLPLLAVLAFSAATYAAEAQKLRIRVTEYPPSVFKGEDGAWTGSELELALAVMREAGFEPEYIDPSWERALEWLKVGKADLMFSLSRTPERESFIDFIGPSKHEQMVLFTHKRNSAMKIETLDDLMRPEGRFAVQDGAFYLGLSDRMATDKVFADSLDIIYDEELAFKMTAKGRILGIFEDINYGRFMIKNNPELSELVAHGFALSEPAKVYLGASRKLDPEVRMRLHKAYERLEKSGEIKKLMDH